MGVHIIIQASTAEVSVEKASFKGLSYGLKIQNQNSAPVMVKNSVFADCNQGLYLKQSTPIIENCLIRNNAAGMKISTAAPTLIANTIRDNKTFGLVYINAAGQAYGHSDQDGQHIIYNGTIQEGNLGGIYCTNSSLLLEAANGGGYNQLAHNGRFGLRAELGSVVTMGDRYGLNSVHDNGVFAVQIYNETIVAAPYNWWGTAFPWSGSIPGYKWDYGLFRSPGKRPF